MSLPGTTRWTWSNRGYAEVSSNGKLNPGWPAIWQMTRDCYTLKTSSKVPDWKRKIARCESATGYLSYKTEQVDNFFFYFGCSYNSGSASQPTIVEKANYGLTAFPLQHDYSIVYQASDKEAIQSAKSSWCRKLRDKNNGVLAGVSIAEARETYDMLKNRSQQMVAGMSGYLKKHVAYRRKKGIGAIEVGLAKQYHPCFSEPRDSRYHRRCDRLPKDLRQKLIDYEKATADYWLEYSFGWRAACADVMDWAKEIEKNPSRGFTDFETLRSSGSTVLRSNSLQAVLNIYAAGLGPQWYWDKETQVKTSVKYYGGWLVKTALENLRTEGFGLSQSDFVPTMWELLPWSWVIDSVSNVGTVLSALSARSAGLRWSQTTSVTEIRSTLKNPSYRFKMAGVSVQDFVTQRYGKQIGSTYSENGSGSASLTTIQLLRVGGTPSDMVPEIAFRIPSGPQAFNLAALFSSKVRPLQKLLSQ